MPRRVLVGGLQADRIRELKALWPQADMVIAATSDDVFHSVGSCDTDVAILGEAMTGLSIETVLIHLRTRLGITGLPIVVVASVETAWTFGSSAATLFGVHATLPLTADAAAIVAAAQLAATTNRLDIVPCSPPLEEVSGLHADTIEYGPDEDATSAGHHIRDSVPPRVERSVADPESLEPPLAVSNGELTARNVTNSVQHAPEHSDESLGLPSMNAPRREEEDAAAAIASLWDRFKDVNFARVSVVEEAALDALEGILDPDGRRRAEREAHKLAGSVGTFGYAQGSALAREIELLLAGTDPLTQAQLLRLSELTVALRQCLEAPAVVDPTPSRATAPNQSVTLRLLIVDPDRDAAERIVAEAFGRGVAARVVANVAAARSSVAERAPDAVVLDLSLPGDDVSDSLALLGDLHGYVPPIPVVVMTARDTFVDRVQVAALGGRGYLSKSTGAARVMDVVERLVGQSRPTGGTVLAVDDDPLVLATIESVLGARGMVVHTLGDPTRFWESLERVTPDVLILDVDMPELSGIDLCKVVRNDVRWNALPILFLTGRSDTSTITEIFEQGADDYIHKPIVGPELVIRIRNRLERAHMFRSMLQTDTLTGVANRRKASETIGQYIGLVERHGQPLAIGLIDIDQFSDLNDRYGHFVGDAVLQQFAAVLTRVFHSEDVVARWGGEEFLVGMYGMSRADGVQRLAGCLEQVRREAFSVGDSGSIRLTFSGGVAAYPDDGDTLLALHRSANTALRAAKEAGRDRVLAVGWESIEESDRVSEAVDIAVVDDDEVLGSLLVHSLETRGYRVEWMKAGDVAVEMLAGAPPPLRAKVILLDVDLPGLSGLAVLRRLAESGVTGRCRIIMLTARSQEAEIVTALELGAFDHVAKPFSLPVLMQRVRRALETS